MLIEEQERLCKEFDKLVIDGFRSQPFMVDTALK